MATNKSATSATPAVSLPEGTPPCRDKRTGRSDYRDKGFPVGPGAVKVETDTVDGKLSGVRAAFLLGAHLNTITLDGNIVGGDWVEGR